MRVILVLLWISMALVLYDLIDGIIEALEEPKRVVMHGPKELNIKSKQIPDVTFISDVEKASEVSHEVEISKEELHLLAQLVSAEAKGEPFDGMVAVANVVLNRVKHKQFPDTIEEVIFQPRQFDPVRNGSIKQDPTERALKASESALNGHEVVRDAIYFYNPEIATDSWIRTRNTERKVGNHIFAN